MKYANWVLVALCIAVCTASTIQEDLDGEIKRCSPKQELVSTWNSVMKQISQAYSLGVTIAILVVFAVALLLVCTPFSFFIQMTSFFNIDGLPASAARSAASVLFVGLITALVGLVILFWYTAEWVWLLRYGTGAVVAAVIVGKFAFN